MADTFAHSYPGRPPEAWEPLGHHLACVAARAAAFAEAFGWAEIARAAGWLHDIGKCSPEFQAYIRKPRDGGARGPDHSTAGAQVAIEAYGDRLVGRLLALAIAGHHAGLQDGDDLQQRLAKVDLPDFSTWRDHVGDLPPIAALKPGAGFRLSPPENRAFYAGFWEAFLIRMVFSCLVDADFLETEAFMSDGEVQRGVDVALDRLLTNLRAHLQALGAGAKPTFVNQLRAEILTHAVAKADAPPGFFTLTVPTGGGKTLASLAFSLEHAVRHGLRRIVYVIPFTSIIEQTAGVFRDALGEPDAILEHHATFDWERAARSRQSPDGGDEVDGLGRLRRAAENWDAPVVVTTAVQFFESLFANRTSACRKLHNLADAVIVLDEAQTLPTDLLLPCLAALDELKRHYGVSVVFCTATQPAIRRVDEALVDGERGLNFGLDIAPERELAPRPKALYAALKRVAVQVRPGVTTDAEIAARFADQPQMLCIVNSRAHARSLFEGIEGLDGAAYLTTLLCPQHRQQVLAEVRRRLKDGAPVRLVATSLIEAGVDVDFPEVWRAMTGLDSIAQAAGRCNREGRLEGLGRTVVFTPAEDAPPRSLLAFREAAEPILRDHADPLTLEANAAYFARLYANRGIEAMDRPRLLPGGVIGALREQADDRGYPFEAIAKAFKLIDETMKPAIVPFDDEARDLLAQAAASERPLRGVLRALQRYSVSLPARAWGDWLASGVLAPVRADLGEALVRFVDLSLYDARTGVNLAQPTYRAAERNVW